MVSVTTVCVLERVECKIFPQQSVNAQSLQPSMEKNCIHGLGEGRVFTCDLSITLVRLISQDDAGIRKSGLFSSLLWSALNTHIISCKQEFAMVDVKTEGKERETDDLKAKLEEEG